MYVMCSECGNLDKSKKNIDKTTGWYQYGCHAKGFTEWFVNKDSDLNMLSCDKSCKHLEKPKAKKIQQLKLF